MKVFGVTGWKNAGKTGLMERLVADITARGFSVSTVKHAHHRFDVDHPGKDSYRHRQAGAREVILASRRRVAQMRELQGDEPTLPALLARLEPVDLVLIEGYKTGGHPKVEAFRAETGHDLIALQDSSIVAVAADVEMALDRPVFDLNDTKAIADFVLDHVGLRPAKSPPSNLQPPPLQNDCFAMPPGVHWTPVEDALDSLRSRMRPMVGVQTVPLEQAAGRVLAKDVTAIGAHPPHSNAAVDGYGFAAETIGQGNTALPLVQGRAAAGQPFDGAVPAGMAIRILTGAILPPGVDTVLLEEDCQTDGTHVAFRGGLKPGANTRLAGEDIQTGAVILPQKRRVTAADLSVAASAGLAELPVYKPLRVGVLSTGDEVQPPGQRCAAGQIYDANRAMLLNMLTQFGHQPVDLGIAKDDRDALRATLDQAEVDAFVTTGGASAGDEDHMSALLQDSGSLNAWRIALKPGRPLALGVWQGKPIFGLPGNPVAAFVCTLIFARPALGVLAGGAWLTPVGYDVPARFSKRKKPGRREYLRARLVDGGVEAFASEGSGRVTGISWADGLVELGDAGQEIKPGDPVRYLPFSGMGLTSG